MRGPRRGEADRGRRVDFGRIDLAAGGFEGLPRPGFVAIGVQGAGGIVGYSQGLDLHGKGGKGVVGWASPACEELISIWQPDQESGALTWVGVTSRPDAELDLHRTLRNLAVGARRGPGDLGDAIHLP